MSNKEIFNKVVEKAEKNGYKIPFAGAIYSYDNSYAGEILTYKQCIFSHDFAKAFWGEKTKEEQIMRYCDMIINDESIIRWKYYLKRMVVEKEPLKYLEKFL